MRKLFTKIFNRKKKEPLTVIDGKKFIIIGGTTYQHSANEKELGIIGKKPRLVDWLIRIPVTDKQLELIDDQVEVMHQVHEYIVDSLTYFTLDMSKFKKSDDK